MNITLYRSPFRTLTALAPFYRPLSIMDEIDEIAREFSRRIGFDGNTLIPHTDIYEEKDKLVVKTELPGVSEKDLEVTLEENMLTIKAEKKDEVAEDATHHAQERYYGKYVRSMSLPFHVNGDKVSATFENGILELRLPKAEELKAKRIEVKAKLPQGERKKRQRKPREKSS
jgi:HSP20 family protein